MSRAVRNPTRVGLRWARRRTTTASARARNYRPGSMQDRPDAPELLAALARWLYDDLRPTLAGEQRFMALVAANACAILAREWVAEGPPAADRAQQRELAQAIR